MTFKDYYKILGIDNIKVSSEEIKTAYRNQAKKFHPDINKESTGEIIQILNPRKNMINYGMDILVEQKKKTFLLLQKKEKIQCLKNYQIFSSATLSKNIV